MLGKKRFGSEPVPRQMTRGTAWRLGPLAALLALTGQAAMGQAPARAPAAPARPATVEGVTVTSTPNAFRTSIDSRSYSITEDLQATSGSIADALKNVPSLEVDVQGNVSLRGDSSVTILIDGKPAGAFRGAGRADALQQMQADSIERVEVMTNPSAAFNPEGGGGVINLITKKGRGAGVTGSARANMGTEGRYNGGVSTAYNSAKLALSADAGLRSNVFKNTSADRRTQTSATGVVTRRSQDSVSRSTNDSKNVRASADYDLTSTLRLSAEIRHNGSDSEQNSAERYLNTDAAGAATGISDRLGATEGKRSNTDGSLGFRKTFAEGHTLAADLSLTKESDERERQYVTRSRLPADVDLFENYRDKTTEDQTELKIDYVRPMTGEATLKAGYALEIDDNDYDNMGARGSAVSSTVIVPALTNRFRYKQTIHAGYATYERPFGDFTVQGGLRFEQVMVDINQLTSAMKEENSYTRLYPSLHLGYKLSDSQTLTASYSHRVRRPRAEDVNPYRVYQDPFNLRAGNPRLEPQETHSVEAGYQYRRNGGYYLATVFYRQSYKGISDVVRDIGGGVLLTTRENLSESRSGGLELVANGKINPKLSYTLNGTTYWNELSAGAANGGATRSAFAFNGRASLNWQVTPNDVLQLSGFASGRRLTAQGYNKPTAVMNLGYRHKFSEQLSLVLTAQDLLNTARNRSVVDTPTLQQTVERRPNARAVFLGLTYTFGSGRRPREAGFEFEGEAAGAAPD